MNPTNPRAAPCAASDVVAIPASWDTMPLRTALDNTLWLTEGIGGAPAAQLADGVYATLTGPFGPVRLRAVQFTRADDGNWDIVHNEIFLSLHALQQIAGLIARGDLSPASQATPTTQDNHR